MGFETTAISQSVSSGCSSTAQPFEQRDRVFPPRHRRHRVAQSLGVGPIGRVGHHRHRCRSDRLGRPLLGADHAPHPQVGAALGVARLVAVDRDDDQRDPDTEAGHDRAEAAVRDDNGATGEQHGMGKIVLNADMRRLRPECGRVALTANPDDEVDRLIAQPGEDRLVEHRCAVHLRRARRRMDQRAARRQGREDCDARQNAAA